jgi:hypothetical protein
MRQQIDLAWLRQDLHQTWFDPLLRRLSPALERVCISELPAKLLEKDSESHIKNRGTAAMGMPPSAPVSASFLANSLIHLRRYDALMLSVSIETLAWTRQCLAAVPRGHVLPIIGVCRQLRSGAMLDLLELGMTDLLCPPVCPQEFRARLIHAVSHAPKPVALREPAKKLQLDAVDPRKPGQARPGADDASTSDSLKISELVWPSIGFQENKRRMVDLFEKHYLRAALRQANGNISEAARRSSKDRRAFWELMRRHGIKPAAKSRQSLGTIQGS